MVEIQVANDCIAFLQSHGFKAYLVGGFVRDIIMKKPAHDIDIATNATTDELIQVFKDFKVIPTGIKHGTLTVIMRDLPIEVTTFRQESSYSDGRHPDEVAFCDDVIEDLKRRDFTMNSIAYCEKEGFIDPFCGKNDIESKLIRCVGNASEKFHEDALRILRAMRFSSVLNFEIELETKKAMFDTKSLLKNVSFERIYVEMSKLLCGENADRVIVQYIDIIAEFLPELAAMKNFEQHNFHHIYDVLTHTSIAVKSTPYVNHLRWAALFHDCGKPETFSLDENQIGHFYRHARKSATIADTALKRLKCDKDTHQKILTLVKVHDTPIELDESLIKKRLSRLGEQMFFDLIKLQRADNLAQSPEFHFRQSYYDSIEKLALKILEQQQCFQLKDLKVNGNDLIKLGLSGKDIGDTLKLVLNEVIENKVPNEKQALLNYIMKINN